MTTPVFQIFSDVVKEAFNYRRKTLLNSLKRLLDPETLKIAGINPGARAQELTVAEYCRIAKAISLK
ncbi:MAG: dimethyladenosine transferase [uncultured bacterium]|nr:MAG: dimethyladenosine transferase [uncultured bacterium]